MHGARNTERQGIDAKAGFVDVKPAVKSAGQPVFMAEFVHPPGGIDDFLLAGVERVTGRADFDMQFLTQRGTRREFVTAAADNFDLVVLRMNFGFHGACRFIPAGAGRFVKGREA